MEQRTRGGARRRGRGDQPRRRKIVVRFTEQELLVLQERASRAGSALAAWVGATVLEVAERGVGPRVGLPDLLRLHTDVLALRDVTAGELGSVDAMVSRLDAAIDAVVAEVEGGRRS